MALRCAVLLAIKFTRHRSTKILHNFVLPCLKNEELPYVLWPRAVKYGGHAEKHYTAIDTQS